MILLQSLRFVSLRGAGGEAIGLLLPGVIMDRFASHAMTLQVSFQL
jgi:hypothetical protein